MVNKKIDVETGIANISLYATATITLSADGSIPVKRDDIIGCLMQFDPDVIIEDIKIWHHNDHNVVTITFKDLDYRAPRSEPISESFEIK